MSLLLTHVEVLTSAPHLLLLAVRTFLLSYAIRFWLYLIQSEVERTDLASQNHNFNQGLFAQNHNFILRH